MITVELNVKNEYVDGAGKVAGAKGSVNSTTVRVTFEGWDGLSKYATTRDSKGENPQMTPLSPSTYVEENTYEFSIPPSAMKEEGLMTITFTGFEVVDGNELTTETNTATCLLRVLPSDFIVDDGSITPTIAEVMQTEINKFTDEFATLHPAVESAVESAKNAKISEEEAKKSEDNAKYSEGIAVSYSTQAKSYAVGGTGSRSFENTDNAKFYYEATRSLAVDFVCVNPLTYQKMSASEAIAYLFSLHMNMITVSELINKGLTVEDVVDLEATCYDIASNGAEVFN